jgi:diacylglycerol kinase family enzyme
VAANLAAEAGDFGLYAFGHLALLNGIQESEPIAPENPVVIIYNPVAGKLRRRSDLLERARDLLARRLGRVELLPTPGPNGGAELARACIGREGARMIVAAGGDGTINEILNGMAGSGAGLGILPFGTANVLANELRMSLDPARVAAELPDYVPTDVAVGRLTGTGAPRYFISMCGAGLDARIVAAVGPELKRRLGKFSYWLGGFSQVGRRLPEFEVVVDGERYTASFVLACRVKNYGGDLEIARHADLLAEDLAVCLFEGPSSLRYVKYFSGVVFNALKGMKGVRLLRARRIELPAAGAPVDLQVDGEHAGFAPCVIEAAPRSLRLLVPPAFARRRSGERSNLA